MNYAEVLLLAYPDLDRMIENEKVGYLERCYQSAYFFEPCDKFAEKLMEKLEIRNRLIDLKSKLDCLYSRLDDEEKALIKFKYCGVLPENKFDFSLRTYFRKQIKLLDKIKEYLTYLNVTEEVFKRDYSKLIYFEVLKEVAEKKRRFKNDVALKKMFA